MTGPPLRSGPVLPRVAAHRLIRFIGRMITKGTQRLTRQVVEPNDPGFELPHEFLAHLGTPETPDVIGDAGNRFLPRLGPKEIPNVVRHLYQVLCTAHDLSLKPGVDRSARQYGSSRR